MHTRIVVCIQTEFVQGVSTNIFKTNIFKTNSHRLLIFSMHLKNQFPIFQLTQIVNLFVTFLFKEFEPKQN